MKLDELPDDMKRQILALTDQFGNLNAISKVSKNFERLSTQTITESMKIGLHYYKKHGSAYDQAELAAGLSTGQPKMKTLNQLLRVSLIAYRENRLIESFVRWNSVTDDEKVSFFDELLKMNRARRILAPKERSVHYIFYAKQKKDIAFLKEHKHYKPQVFMDFIVRYVYKRVMELTT